MAKGRKLVSLYKIWSIEPAENADRLEIARLGGWRCVVPKGQYHKGDEVVFFEEDSWLPLDDPRYDFLKKTCYKKNDFMGEGILVRNRTIRGNESEGLVLPREMFPELDEYEVGDVVTDDLGVRKFMVPEIEGSGGTMIGDKPAYIPTTDELRVQSEDSLRQALIGLPYYISTKIDGTSCSMWIMKGKRGVSGRKKMYKDNDSSPMWTYAHKINLFEQLEADGWEGIIQGEFAGPKIQSNPLGLFEAEYFVFNVFDKDRNLYPLDKMTEFCNKYGLKMVPINEVGYEFNYSQDELIEKSRGNYENGHTREGIVVRPITPVYNETLGKSLSFKMINPDYHPYDTK